MPNNPSYIILGNDGLVCKHCHKSFNKRYHHFIEHLAAVHKHGPMPFNCNKCNKKRYATRTTLNKHQNVCKGPQIEVQVNEETEFQCGVCDRNFDSAQDVRQHVSFQHESEYTQYRNIRNYTQILENLRNAMVFFFV